MQSFIVGIDSLTDRVYATYFENARGQQVLAALAEGRQRFGVCIARLSYNDKGKDKWRTETSSVRVRTRISGMFWKIFPLVSRERRRK